MLALGDRASSLKEATVDLAPLRWPAVGMLAAGVTMNVVPGDQGIPCPLRALTGVPCPLCGMTTSVTATLRGDLSEAIAANPVGVVVAATAILVALGLLRRRIAVPVGAIYGALALLWLFQLNRFSLI